MRRSYDPSVDILYITLSDSSVLESEEIRPGLVADFESEGRIVGFEIMDAHRTVAPDAFTNLQAAE